MRRIAVAAVSAIVLLTAAPALAAGEVAVDDVDISAFPEVSVTVTLPPELAGRDLPPEAFGIVEGETTVVPAVERLANEDLEVVMLLDTSLSMNGEPLDAAVAAVASFAASMPDEVRIAIVTFSTTPTIVSDFVPPVDIPDALEGIAAGGETSLYDGLVTAAGLWDGAASSRRALVMLSDGGDTISSAALEDSIIAVVGSGAQFYAVELQSPESDPEALQRLEAAAGGTLVGADDPEAIASIFDEIAGELTSRYTLTYTSASAGVTDISVEVAFDGVSASGVAQASLPVPPTFSPEASRVTTPVAPPEPEVVVTRLADPGLFGGNDVAILGGAFLFAGLWGLVRSTQRDGDEDTPWRPPPAPVSHKASTGKALSSFAARASSFAERQLKRSHQASGLAVKLERAGSALRPGEYLVLSGSFGIAALAVGRVLGGWPVAIGLSLATLGMAAAWLNQRAARRQKAFANQLGDALLLIAGGLQAGHGIIQACDAVASEEMEPASEEFRRLIAETRLGRDFTEALRALGERVGGDDFRWVTDAIDIHREVGGNLSEVLRSIAETIRSRNQVRRRVETLSAEGKLSGIVLISLPFVVGALVTASNPDYLSPLFEPGPGRVILGGGIGLMIAGALWIRRIVTLRF